ncbi:MAG: 3'-5' exonuclease, partial [Clostridia bacterium]|jgi:ATP-dependent helicase/nuclease subunit A
MPRKKMDFDISVVDIVKDYRDKVKSVIKVLTAQLYDSEVNIKNDCVFMHCTIMKFIETIIRTNEKYSKIKIKAKLIDYADMEHMALKCLKSGANLLYKEKFKHILIDEYQDFNFIQENIINLISNKNNVFAVGDLKQSIYKFRNAQTAIFKEKSTRFCNFNEGRKLSLSYNFRSRKKILNYVNEIFSNIMNEDFGEVEYGDEEKLMYGAFQYSDELDNSDYLPSVIKIRFDKSDDIINSDITQNEAEVYIVADQIKKVIESKMKIHDSISNKFRPVRSSDIVILMRSVNAYAKQYCEILNKCGILAHCEQNIEILDKKSISDLLALLNIIDNPYQDIYLVQIMKNEVYNFNESELAFIRRGKYGLYDDLVSYPENDKLKLKIARFLNDIKDMWMFSQRNTVEKTIYYAMTKSGIYYLSKEQHLLKKFYVLSVECLQKGIDDLSSFLNFIKSKSKKDLTIISDVMGTEENESVRIMSIHKSKGLEFPVVILTGCSRGFNIEDTKKRLIIDRNLGIGSDYINCENKTYHKHITKNALSLSIKKQNLSEEMRILYVALTRAKEKLIITGIDKQTEPAYVPEDAKNYFDWILPNTDKSLIQTITEAECDIKISELTKRSELADNCNMKVFDSSFYQDIMKKISFEYPYNEEIKLNRKLSVTELTKYQSKNYSIEDFYDQYHTNPKKQPSFLDKSQKSINAAKKGTIMHKIMASVDLKKLNDPNYISYLKSKIGENEYINNLISFISTPIYNEIIDAETIFQEKVFFMPVNTSYIESFTGHHFEKDHIILLQGVIDCFFIKNGFGTIIDYKTDKIKKGQEEQHALKYKNQLDIYANAIENIMGIKISNKIIHFFETNTNIDLNLI